MGGSGITMEQVDAIAKHSPRSDSAVLPESHMVHSGVKTAVLRMGSGSGSHKSRLLSGG